MKIDVGHFLNRIQSLHFYVNLGLLIKPATRAGSELEIRLRSCLKVRAIIKVKAFTANCFCVCYGHVVGDDESRPVAADAVGDLGLGGGLGGACRSIFFTSLGVNAYIGTSLFSTV
jgi:hypothetical protein